MAGEIQTPNVNDLHMAASLPAVFANKFVAVGNPSGLRVTFVDAGVMQEAQIPRVSVLIPWAEAGDLVKILQTALEAAEGQENG